MLLEPRPRITANVTGQIVFVTAKAREPTPIIAMIVPMRLLTIELSGWHEAHSAPATTPPLGERAATTMFAGPQQRVVRRHDRY